MTYQAPITGLHSPKLLPFLQNFTDCIMLAQSCKFKVNCCFIGLIHPAACTRARVPLTFGRVHSPPPLTQFAQKGCQSTGLELRIPMIYLKFRRSGPVNFSRGGRKTLDPPPPLPPFRSNPYIYQSKALNVRIPNIIFIGICTCRPKVMLPAASCQASKYLEARVIVCVCARARVCACAHVCV